MTEASRQAHVSPLYQLREVHKTKERGGVRFNLHVPEFEIRPGEMISVVGPSGCGKSTLLDLLALISKPDLVEKFAIKLRESVPVFISSTGLNERRAAELRRRHFGYVLQRGGLLPSLTCEENILLPRRLAGLAASPESIATLVERLGIKKQLKKKPAYLSGGERQRVAIARALSHHPELILADEPTGSVDRNKAEEIGQLLKSLAQEQNTAVVLVTHDRELAARYVARSYGFISVENEKGEATSILEARSHV